MLKIILLTIVSLTLFACSSSSNQNKFANNNSKFVASSYFCAPNGAPSGKDSGSNIEYFYTQMHSCVVAGNYKSATVLFSLAGSLSWYKATLEQSDVSINQHSLLLKNTLATFTPAQRSLFWENTHAVLGSPLSLDKLCNELDTLSVDIESSQLNKMNLDVTWRDALDHYLHCPIK